MGAKCVHKMLEYGLYGREFPPAALTFVRVKVNAKKRIEMLEVETKEKEEKINELEKEIKTLRHRRQQSR